MNPTPAPRKPPAKLLLLALLGALAAVPPASGWLIERQLQDALGRYHDSGDGVSRTTLNLERGYGESRGRLLVRVDGEALLPGDDPQSAQLRSLLAEPLCVQVRLRHTGFAGAQLASYDAEPCFRGELAALERRYWGDGPLFRSEGELDIAGVWRDHTAINGFTHRDRGFRAELEPLQLTLEGRLDGIATLTVEGAGFGTWSPSRALELGAISARIEGNLRLGTGQLRLALARLVWRQEDALPLVIDGLEATAERVGDDADDLGVAIARLALPGHEAPLDDVRLVATMASVDWRALTALGLAAAEPPARSGGVAALLAAHSAQARALLGRRPSLRVEEASVLIDDRRQSLHSQLFYIGSGEPASFDWRRDLEGAAVFDVSGQFIERALAAAGAKALAADQPGLSPAELQSKAQTAAGQQLRLLLALGLIDTAEGDGLRLRIDLRQRSLRVNGRSIDALLKLLLPAG